MYYILYDEFNLQYKKEDHLLVSRSVLATYLMFWYMYRGVDFCIVFLEYFYRIRGSDWYICLYPSGPRSQRFHPLELISYLIWICISTKSVYKLHVPWLPGPVFLGLLGSLNLFILSVHCIIICMYLILQIVNFTIYRMDADCLL